MAYFNLMMYTLMTHNIPNVWQSADHLCVVWCLQFVLVVNRFLHSIIDLDKKSNSKFIANKEIRLTKAYQFFMGGPSSGAEQLSTLTNNMIDEEDWIEDIRRNFQHKFDTGLPKTRVQMIRLDPNPLYKIRYAREPTANRTCSRISPTGSSVRPDPKKKTFENRGQATWKVRRGGSKPALGKSGIGGRKHTRWHRLSRLTLIPLAALDLAP
ncbi:GPI inositol-deacylase isoform X2 [Culex pipiens pallens]|uniref:GPI inositol-deacylase isoform X2 n=1 Tax=Culex pipiens pallens TaxID=42434 RepID=UPI001953105A|nr:GPI inositol-deacylase isoform X2 [Culex pipiens pallens]